LGTKVYLELHVKVKEDWKKDKRFLKEIGLV
jgi:GTPase Era involved in 16S rRNA processing